MKSLGILFKIKHSMKDISYLDNNNERRHNCWTEIS